LLPPRLAEPPQPGQAQRGIPGTVEAGPGVVSRALPPGFRAAPAAAPRVGPTTGDVGLALGAGREAVRPIEGVRRGVLAPRRAPHEQHARSDDARDEPLLRPRPAPARLARRLPAPLPGLGPAGELRPLAPGGRPRERGMA